MVCHRSGGVIATAHSYSVSIHNLKGLSLYASYTLDLPPSLLDFSPNGKQIVTACNDKLRIITPKTEEIVKVAGNHFHQAEITSLAVSPTVILSGCIEGEVFASNLGKGNILGKFDSFKGAINSISIADNYALIAPQSNGVFWNDINKLKTIFHSPPDISVTAIAKISHSHNYAFSDLKGSIHLVDSRAPMKIIKKLEAGNSIHALE